MSTRMLIDARHQEETRVAVVKGNKIEEFDFESSDHKQLKGNIYLAKVTRVEPSLQAAFVDYGGNRHGFLAFSEIHPDYYQIPQEDRERLLAEEAEHAAEEAALRAQEEEEDDTPSDMVRSEATEELDTALVEVEKDESVDTIDVTEGKIPDDDDDSDDSDSDDSDDDDDEESTGDDNEAGNGRRNNRGRGKGRNRGRSGDNEGRGNVAKASDQARQKRMALRKRYKIQDVIQRRQVVLVQVVKEERGNKGAALTTYLSLAGRYCVLMPNTSHGGGISRKINNAGDRKRLKSIIADLNLPNSMGCIVRTAGLSRTKPEIKRDFDYLARLWDEVREKTLGAVAPALIHSDSDLIKRAIRDIYNREIEEVLVEGAEGYAAAKNFMKLLMPSHSRRVKSYADPVSLFQRYGVEDQLSAMYQPEVQLKSGGYLVINPTEALVSIDINSGRSTREHGIEATAVKTNLEAAAEIARQLRLRDMAGLVVIDFIDMDRHSNVRKVERAMRDALKNDRARIQVGRISSFGLLEMSRQRLRTGVLEASTKVCPHCEGTGLVRTASSAALSALRLIEEEAAKGKASQITLTTSQEATIYVLNSKRHEIGEIEQRYGVTVEITPDGEIEGARMEVKGSGSPPKNAPKFEPIIDVDDEEEDTASDVAAQETGSEENAPRKRRGRRGRRGGRRDRNGSETASNNENGDNDNATEQASEPSEAETAEQSSDSGDKPRSRRSRGGRNRKPSDGAVAAAEGSETDSAKAKAPVEAGTDEAAESAEKPKRARRSRSKKTDASEAATEATPNAEEAPVPEAEEKPKRRRAPRKSKAVAKSPEAAQAPETEEATTAPTESGGDATTEEPAAKPAVKRASRSRAKKADVDGAETTDKPAAKPAARRTAAKKPAVKASEESAPKETAPAENETSESVSSESVPSESTSEKTAKSEKSDPPRAGWWQRTFG
ncbi:Rne/Rng family ribonuclease [Parasphingorhabdus sp.]|uniref:ribonuclease E/G n=1 Tax=Parasphingorhabdus sp. TaxID=2709688 RepID=UPI002F943B70